MLPERHILSLDRKAIRSPQQDLRHNTSAQIIYKILLPTSMVLGRFQQLTATICHSLLLIQTSLLIRWRSMNRSRAVSELVVDHILFTIILHNQCRVTQMHER